MQTQPLTVISDTRLGIDASYYLTQLTENPPSREPLLAATGGLPLALVSRIESDLRVLEKLRIKPVFVFPGLIPNRRWKHPPPHQHEQNDAMRDRKEAWSKYEAGQEEAATKLFETRSCLHQWDLWRMVLRIFRHRNVEYIVAPYIAWAQVCAFASLYSASIYNYPFTCFFSSFTCNAIQRLTSMLFLGPPKRFSTQALTSSLLPSTSLQTPLPSTLSTNALSSTNSVSILRNNFLMLAS